jgi:uncharacterized SAM-binding protein YcdF (DUF218 family)
MLFVLSKTAAFLLLPSNILFALGFVGLLLSATRWRRFGRRLMIASVVLLALAAYLPLGGALTHVLEARFPPWDSTRGAPDGIVVLGGGISPALSQAYGDIQLNAGAERVTIIPKLARAYPNARIVFSGGDASVLQNKGREADYLYPLLDAFGVPRARVMIENRARNTYENAVFTKELAKPKPGERWLLVTSAEHMPRAVGCFRQAGFPVEAYPVDWRTRPRFTWLPNGRFGAGLAALDRAAHEWAGLLFYRIAGRTSAFFPSPTP